MSLCGAAETTAHSSIRRDREAMFSCLLEVVAVRIQGCESVDWIEEKQIYRKVRIVNLWIKFPLLSPALSSIGSGNCEQSDWIASKLMLVSCRRQAAEHIEAGEKGHFIPVPCSRCVGLHPIYMIRVWRFNVAPDRQLSNFPRITSSRLLALFHKRCFIMFGQEITAKSPSWLRR